MTTATVLEFVREGMTTTFAPFPFFCRGKGHFAVCMSPYLSNVVHILSHAMNFVDWNIETRKNINTVGYANPH